MTKIKYRRQAANRWDDLKSIKRKDFSKGIVKVGMPPAERFEETLWCENFCNTFNERYAQENGLKCLHHVRINKRGFIIPDISFWELDQSQQATGKREVVIEIGRKKDLGGRKGIRNKLISSVKRHQIKEGFIYVIDTQKWMKYVSGSGWKKTELSYSSIIGTDFNVFPNAKK